ncbi:MAG: IclR family transcriptional regulator [Chloroflexi bacterium]|nr:IclR family transcriptional regulator [Chloroflexota bacterium]
METAASSSLRRALSVLSWIAFQQRPCGVREIAAATAVNKTSVHRFLDAMRREGWVVQDSSTEKYRLGPVPVEIGLSALAGMEFRAVARPLLESMARRTGETSYLGILLGADVVYVDVVLGGHAIVARQEIGARFPAHRTAIGKVLLAQLPPAQPDELLVGSREVAGTLDLAHRDLAALRDACLAHNDEESAPGVYSLAAPLRDFSGRVVAGLGLGGPKSRLLPHLSEYGDLVKETAAAASKAMGYHEAGTAKSAGIR